MATIFRPPVVTRSPARDSSAAVLSQSGVTGINILVHTNPVPFHQTDWPVPPGPIPRGIELRTYLNAVELLLLPLPPIRQYDWPVPKGPVGTIELRNETQPLPIQLLPKPPIRQFDWPVPAGRQYPLSLRTHTASPFPPPAPVTPSPFTQTDWPVPKGPEWNRDLRSHSESLVLAQIYGVKPAGLSSELSSSPFQGRVKGLNSGLEFQPPNLLTSTLGTVTPTSGLYDIWHYYSP